MAELMGRPEQAISEIVNAKKRVTPQTAIQLGHVFGTSALFWANIEVSYRVAMAIREETIGREVDQLDEAQA